MQQKKNVFVSYPSVSTKIKRDSKAAVGPTVRDTELSRPMGESVSMAVDTLVVGEVTATTMVGKVTANVGIHKHTHHSHYL